MAKPISRSRVLSEAAAARRLDPDDVVGAQLSRDFRRLLLAVHERASARAVLSSASAVRRVRATLRKHREPAVLEHAQLAHDTVAAAVHACAARTRTQLPALDA